jgi:hypothetical protein
MCTLYPRGNGLSIGIWGYMCGRVNLAASFVVVFGTSPHIHKEYAPGGGFSVTDDPRLRRGRPASKFPPSAKDKCVLHLRVIASDQTFVFQHYHFNSRGASSAAEQVEEVKNVPVVSPGLVVYTFLLQDLEPSPKPFDNTGGHPDSGRGWPRKLAVTDYSTFSDRVKVSRLRGEGT